MNSLLEADDNLQIDPNKDYFVELVGEGRKFKTPQDLAKGKYESDTYIKLLEKKLDQRDADYKRLSDEYNAREKLAELVDRHDKQQQLTLSNESTHTVNDVKIPEIDPKQIESLVDTRIKHNKIQEKEQENFNLVKTKLQESLGSNYQESLMKKLKGLDLTPEELDAWSKRSPNAVIKALELERQPQEDFQSPPRSSRRSDNFSPKGGPKRTWSYYQELRKSNPNLYNDPKTTIQMEKDYLALGQDFEDGDFHS